MKPIRIQGFGPRGRDDLRVLSIDWLCELFGMLSFLPRYIFTSRSLISIGNSVQYEFFDRELEIFSPLSRASCNQFPSESYKTPNYLLLKGLKTIYGGFVPVKTNNSPPRAFS